MEWQPIETAPKDGTWILCYDEFCSDADMAVVHWDGDMFASDDVFCDTATHWMPLPEPPK